MGLFRRKQKVAMPPPITVGRHKVVEYTKDGALKFNARTVEEAKLAIQEIRLQKKEIALQKKQIAAELKNLRAARSLSVARRGSMPRGGGKLGRFVRTVEHINRDADRAQHANAVAPLEGQRAQLDQILIDLDRGIAQLEAFIARSRPR